MVTDLLFDRSLFDKSCFWHLIQSPKHLILIWFETIGPVGHLGSLGEVEHGVTAKNNNVHVKLLNLKRKRTRQKYVQK